MATTILWSDLKVEDMIQEHFAKNTEKDPGEKWEQVITAVSIALAKRIRDKTGTLWPVLEKVGTGEEEVSLADSDFAGDLIVWIEKRLIEYLPLAFAELSKRVVAEVEKKLTFKKWYGATEADFQKTREVLLTSVLWNYSKEGQINYDVFESRAAEGYAGLMRDIFIQAEKLNWIKPSEFNASLLSAYRENSPLTIS